MKNFLVSLGRGTTITVTGKDAWSVQLSLEEVLGATVSLLAIKEIKEDRDAKG